VKLALIGFMGAGKTTAARMLKGAADVDEVIEAREGRRVQEIFASDGEAAFRELEERVTLELIDDPAVTAVALGGGAVGSALVCQALASRCRVIWLETVDDLAWRRVSRGGEGDPERPLAGDIRRFSELHAARRPIYERLADVIVPATRSHEIPRVLAALEGVPDGSDVKLIWATSASADYPVYIGSGLLAGEAHWPAGLSGRRVLITDYNAGRHWGDRLGPYLGEIRIMPGEQSKTIAHAEIVWTEMVRHGTTRGDVVVAVGGGVVGDLGGFCAATYQRGIRFVQVPTTLVAQVDSAYGGKTGVDLAEAKNYIGAFHQPAAVITDPDALATLPPEEVAAGYAEVVKTALLTGGPLWELVRGGAEPTDPEVITRCAHYKLTLVGQDERDGGVRQLLNLGHTIGHAIETATGYARYRHGEAVGLGMLAELRLAGADDLRAEVAALLDDNGLPTELDPEVELDAVIFATGRDKKRIGEAPVPFVACQRPGRCFVGQTFPLAEIRACVRELLV
jgi:shikimate kinase / 3-dehydroquinate synthase